MTQPQRIPRARTVEPSHAVIIERIEALGAIMSEKFEGLEGRAEIRFDGLEGRMKRVEDHLDRPAHETPKWLPYAIASGVVLSVLAGAGLSIIAITQLDLFGPLLDAADRVHGAKQ